MLQCINVINWFILQLIDIKSLHIFSIKNEVTKYLFFMWYHFDQNQYFLPSREDNPSVTQWNQGVPWWSKPKKFKTSMPKWKEDQPYHFWTTLYFILIYTQILGLPIFLFILWKCCRNGTYRKVLIVW